MEFLQENLLNNSASTIPHTNVRASLRIMGEDFDIQEVTEMLDISPSETWRKGDFVRNTKRLRTYTAWIYNTEVLETLNICALTEQINLIFSPKVDKIAFLKKEYDLDISIDFIVVVENDDPPSIYFESDFIKFASKIGAQFDIDMYIN